MNFELVELRGLAWDHPRATVPFSGELKRAGSNKSIVVHWSVRSLHEFEMGDLDRWGDDFDVVMIDHPTIGQAIKDGGLLSIDEVLGDEAICRLRASILSKAFECYSYEGSQWAIPIDVSAHVGAYCPQTITAQNLPVTWSDVLSLGRDGVSIAVPLKGSHAFLSLQAIGRAQGALSDDRNVDEMQRWILSEESVPAIETLVQLSKMRKFVGLGMDPIGVYELLARGEVTFSPLIFGYVTYAWRRWSKLPYEVAYCSAPKWTDSGRFGSILGGVGLAVTRNCSSKENVAELLHLLTDLDVEGWCIGARGGQPASVKWWDNPHPVESVRSFYQNTRATVEDAWIRPIGVGYPKLQFVVGSLIEQCLVAGQSSLEIADRVRHVWLSSEEL